MDGYHVRDMHAVLEFPDGAQAPMSMDLVFLGTDGTAYGCSFHYLTVCHREGRISLDLSVPMEGRSLIPKDFLKADAVLHYEGIEEMPEASVASLSWHIEREPGTLEACTPMAWAVNQNGGCSFTATSRLLAAMGLQSVIDPVFLTLSEIWDGRPIKEHHIKGNTLEGCFQQVWELEQASKEPGRQYELADGNRKADYEDWKSKTKGEQI